MNNDQILAGVRDVFRQHLEIPSGIELDTNILRDLQLDSLRQLTLVVELENHFKVCFEAGDERGIETVHDVVELVGRSLAASPPAEAPHG